MTNLSSSSLADCRCGVWVGFVRNITAFSVAFSVYRFAVLQVVSPHPQIYRLAISTTSVYSQHRSRPWPVPCPAPAPPGKIPSHVSRLRKRIYGNTRFEPLLRLPHCANNISVFVYDLPGRYHVDAIRTLEKKQRKSNCDWQTSPCVEKDWDGGATGYSTLRSIIAIEIVLLHKFLSFPRITEDPDVADLFVVPFLAATVVASMGKPYGGGNNQTGRLIDDLLQSLTFFGDPAKRRRHLFLATHDRCNVDAFLLDRARDSLILHSGPRARLGEIVTVSAGAAFGSPLLKLLPNANGVFFLASNAKEADGSFVLRKEARAQMHSELERLLMKYPKINATVMTIQGKTLQAPPHLHWIWRNSLLCPIPEGDYTHSHRLFDVMVSGCVPLFIVSRRLNTSALWRSKPAHCKNPDASACENPGRVVQEIRARQSEGKCEYWMFNKPYWPPSCVQDSLPFPSQMNWTSISMQIDEASFWNGSFVDIVAKMVGSSVGDVRLKRRNLDVVRSLFTYDWGGRSFDAFSATMQEICQVADHTTHANWQAFGEDIISERPKWWQRAARGTACYLGR